MTCDYKNAPHCSTHIHHRLLRSKILVRLRQCIRRAIIYIDHMRLHHVSLVSLLSHIKIEPSISVLAHRQTSNYALLHVRVTILGPFLSNNLLQVAAGKSAYLSVQTRKTIQDSSHKEYSGVNA